MSEINTVTNNYGTFNNFSCGGLALSKWNYRTNPSSAEVITITGDTIPSDWWYSYNNQMSVYDTTSVNGSNEGACDEVILLLFMVILMNIIPNGWLNPNSI